MLSGHQKHNAEQPGGGHKLPPRRFRSDKYLTGDRYDRHTQQKRTQDSRFGPQVKKRVVRPKLRLPEKQRSVSGGAQAKQRLTRVLGKVIEQLRPLGEAIVVGAQRIGVRVLHNFGGK